LPSKEVLFDGKSDLFEKALKSATVYGEYGLGTSTKFVLNNTNLNIISCDTAQEWVQQFSQMNPNRLKVEYVNVGSVSDWGYPVGYSKRDQFHKYYESIWTNHEKPDLVLIDGRFRVACFCYSLLYSNPGCQIIFDDYVERPQYHVVEELVSPAEVSERQALFITPHNFDRQIATEMLNSFKFVMD
jgi:hypothetical protein